MKKVALMALVLATLSVGACASYHQSYKGSNGMASSDEAAARAAVYGSADKTSKVK